MTADNSSATAQKNVRDRADVKARELLDLPLRYEDMLATNVDMQVVFPTLFLAYLITTSPAIGFI